MEGSFAASTARIDDRELQIAPKPRELLRRGENQTGALQPVEGSASRREREQHAAQPPVPKWEFGRYPSTRARSRSRRIRERQSMLAASQTTGVSRPASTSIVSRKQQRPSPAGSTRIS